MWTPDITKSRFVEAAETERYLPRPRMGTGAGFWPLHQYTAEDREGWDDAARADSADQWARNRKLTREAISRHDECLHWSMTILGQEAHRHIVWKWSFCQINGWSFSEACKRKNWVRVTAYRRLTASFERISAHLNKEQVLLRLPDARHLVTEIEFGANDSGKVNRNVADLPSAIPFTPSFRTEPSRDLLKTPEDVIQFSKHLARTNSDRAREQKRRELCERGVA
jgi:PAS domain-containing protein